jgi:prepilin-type processing-associated H-X9-DG protein
MAVALKKHARGAFTIIELLVVISIIMLLIALLLPALRLARDAARAMRCRTNLQQQGIGLNNYTTDTGYYPGAHTWTPFHGGAANYIVWAPRIRTAGADAGVFHCPVSDPAAIWTPTFGSGLPAEWGYLPDEVRLTATTKFGYGYNNWGAGPDTPPPTSPQLGLGGFVWSTQRPDWAEIIAETVRKPSDMIAVGDAQVNAVWDAFIDPNDGASEYPEPRHPNEMANLLFCDGHVESDTLEHLIFNPALAIGSPDNYAQWNTSNR